jgi:SAM-dependent methyltransferase
MSAVLAPTAPAADLSALKLKQHAAWSAGDYAVIGSTLQIVGESLAEALDLQSGQRVLDVAAGNGNATLAAARRWCDVVSTDYVGALLERGKARATADGLKAQFQEADAENLPFKDGAFDAVMSTFGVMFTPDQARAANEMARVCRSGGQIGLANWTPNGFIGQLFKLIGRYIPPPAGVSSPALWGTEARLHELFEGRIGKIDVTRKDFVFRYRSPAHWLEIFRGYYGPVQKAFIAVGADKEDALTADLTALIGQFNRPGAATLVVPSEYLEVVMTIR